MIGLKCHQGATYLATNKFKFVYINGIIMILGPTGNSKKYFVISGDGKLVRTNDPNFNKTVAGVWHFYVKYYH